MRQEVLRADKRGKAQYEAMSALLREAAGTKPLFSFEARTKAAARKWRRKALAAFKRALGREPDKAVLKPVLRAREKCDGYTLEAYQVETAPGLVCPYFVLIPDGLPAKAPALLCAHGHGDGVNPLVGYDRRGRRLRKREYQREFAIQAVRNGFVTLAHEQIGFGRRVDFRWRMVHKAEECYSPCVQPSLVALQLGYTMSGLRVFEARRMLDILAARPEVDAKRVGMAGISGGGLVTLYTAAVDRRIKAACVSGYINTFLHSIMSLHHCPDNYVPGLARILDIADIACLVVPRPLLAEAGTKDEYFPVAAVRLAAKTIRKAYAAYDAPGAFEIDYFEGRHQFSGRRTWDFFSKHL